MHDAMLASPIGVAASVRVPMTERATVPFACAWPGNLAMIECMVQA